MYLVSNKTKEKIKDEHRNEIMEIKTVKSNKLKAGVTLYLHKLPCNAYLNRMSEDKWSDKFYAALSCSDGFNFI